MCSQCTLREGGRGGEGREEARQLGHVLISIGTQWQRLCLVFVFFHFRFPHVDMLKMMMMMMMMWSMMMMKLVLLCLMMKSAAWTLSASVSD